MFNRADWLMSQSDAVDPAKSVSFAYDLNGNQTGRGTATSTRQMKWDARNTLTAVYENGTEVGRYDYDRNLIRVRRTTQTENVEYVLDDKHVLNELDGSQAGKPSIRRYHYGTKVLAVTESAGTSYVLNDGIGSATDFWSASGTLAKSRQYDAWGNFRNGTAPAAGEAKVAYTGHQYDPETGWVYAKARYYDSGLGVFLSRDSYPFGPTDAPNLYLYARGNPLRYWDPDGYFFKEMVEGMENLPGAAWNLAKEFGGYVKGNVQEIGEDLGLAQPESREATPLKVPEAARREIPQYVAPTEEQVADRIEKASFEAPRANVPQQGGGRKEMTVFEGKQDRLVRQQRVDRAQAKEIAKAVAQEVASAAIVAGTVIATDMVAEYAAPLVRGSDVAEVGARGFSAEGRMARAGKRPVLNQGNAPICGKTSADMVLDDLVPGVPRNVQGMPTPTKTGVGIDKVANYLERNNVNARFQPWTTVDELAEATAKGDPAIAAVRQKAWDPEVGKMVEGGHAVVVDGVTTRQGVRVVAVRDPWGTQYFETVESFSDRWIKGQTVVTNGVKPSP
jgi:RHS repeat-associated protein